MYTDRDGDTWPSAGDTAVFLAKNGYDHQLEEAKQLFEEGESLIVKRFNLGNWSSTVEFEGHKGSFNSVMFDFIGFVE